MSSPCRALPVLMLAASAVVLASACDTGRVGGAQDAGGSGPRADARADAATAADSGGVADDATMVVQDDATTPPPDVGFAEDALPGDTGGDPVDATPGPSDAGFADDAMVLPDAGPAVGRPLFLAVGYGRRHLISRDAVTWTNDVIVDPNGGDDNNLYRGAAWGDGRFMAVGGAAQGRTITSVDGVTWTNEVTGLGSFVSSAQFGNGVWVAVGGNGFRQRSLDHGASWVDDAGYIACHFRRLAFGNGVFVAVGHMYGATNHAVVATTTDGRMWTVREQPGLAGFGDVSFGNGVFVATGGTRIARSTDGLMWTEVTTITTAGTEGVSFANGEHVLSTREALHHSPDAVTWTRVAGFAPGAIAHASGVYVGSVWMSQRWISNNLAQGWRRTGMDDGPAITEIVVGDVP